MDEWMDDVWGLGPRNRFSGWAVNKQQTDYFTSGRTKNENTLIKIFSN